MKYTFDLNKRNRRYELKIDISSGNAFTGGVQKVLNTPDNNIKWQYHLEDLLNDMIDNMRLTVSEREEARDNLKVFLDYIVNNQSKDGIKIDDELILDSIDESINISENIENLEQHLKKIGYPNYAIHTGPIIRREQYYKYELMENRKTLFNSLYHFTRKIDIRSNFEF